MTDSSRDDFAHALEVFTAWLRNLGCKPVNARMDLDENGKPCGVRVDLCPDAAAPKVECETAPENDEPAIQECPAGEIADAILSVLAATDRPLKIVTIASRACCVHNSHFRQTVRLLKKAGKISSLSEHRYWLAGRDLPPARS